MFNLKVNKIRKHDYADERVLLALEKSSELMDILTFVKNFKEAIMSLTTKRSKEIRKYYLLLEELVQLYGAYTHQFKDRQLV